MRHAAPHCSVLVASNQLQGVGISCCHTFWKTWHTGDKLRFKYSHLDWRQSQDCFAWKLGKQCPTIWWWTIISPYFFHMKIFHHFPIIFPHFPHHFSYAKFFMINHIISRWFPHLEAAFWVTKTSTPDGFGGCLCGCRRWVIPDGGTIPLPKCIYIYIHIVYVYIHIYIYTYIYIYIHIFVDGVQTYQSFPVMGHSCSSPQEFCRARLGKQGPTPLSATYYGIWIDPHILV